MKQFIYNMLQRLMKNKKKSFKIAMSEVEKYLNRTMRIVRMNNITAICETIKTGKRFTISNIY